jgi:hypothetical protein
MQHLDSSPPQPGIGERYLNSASSTNLQGLCIVSQLSSIHMQHASLAISNRSIQVLQAGLTASSQLTHEQRNGWLQQGMHIA